MNYLLFPIFILKLLTHLISFLLLILFKTKKQLIRMLLLTLATILSILTLVLSFYNQQQKRQLLTSQKSVYIDQLIKQKQKFLEVLKKQPTHRDALINLSVLSCQLEEWDDCNNYFNQAKKLDPNNPFFKNFSPFPGN